MRQAGVQYVPLTTLRSGSSISSMRVNANGLAGRVGTGVALGRTVAVACLVGCGKGGVGVGSELQALTAAIRINITQAASTFEMLFLFPPNVSLLHVRFRTLRGRRPTEKYTTCR